MESSFTKEIFARTSSLPRAIGAFMLCRFALDSALRAPLPFLGVIAAAYGQSASTVGWLSIALALAGLAAPITGVLSQRFGQRKLVFLPMLAFVATCALLAVAPSLGMVAALFVLLGVAKSMFDPQMQAFIGEHVPYKRRGSVIGIVELSWALSFVISAPLFGFLVPRTGWWVPFLLMGLAAGLGTLALWKTARSGMHNSHPAATFSLAAWRTVWQNSRARLYWLYAFGITFAAQMPYLVYPPWLQGQFTLSTEQLGVASAVIGIADLVAELLAVALVDRVGKRLAVVASAVFYAAAYTLFWLLSGSLLGVLVALFCIYLAFEFTLVASLAVASEIVPSARAAMMGFGGAAFTLGRIAGSLAALPLFMGLGGGGGAGMGFVALVGTVAIGISIMASLLVTRSQPNQPAMG
jgi:predicted MFS family arabinose efflux permease